MNAAYEWFRASRHRNVRAARRRRDELVRNGWRAREVRVQRIDGTQPWTHAVMVRKEVTP